MHRLPQGGRVPALFGSDWLADAPYEDRELGVLKAGKQIDHGYRMAFIGDGQQAAPRLSEVHLDLSTARQVWRDVQIEIRTMLDADLVHGDLSAYNILWWRGRAVLIDFSQSVDVVTHPASRELLYRDVERTAGYFRRMGVTIDTAAALALVGDSPSRFARQVLSS